jgi:hypothetical protein
MNFASCMYFNIRVSQNINVSMFLLQGADDLRTEIREEVEGGRSFRKGLAYFRKLHGSGLHGPHPLLYLLMRQ